MDYLDALLANISKDDAKREILKHGCSWEDFLAQFGDHEEYDGSDIVNFLGY